MGRCTYSPEFKLQAVLEALQLDGTNAGVDRAYDRLQPSGGPDHLQWEAALCPNCHWRGHSGKDGDEHDDRVARRPEKMEVGPSDSRCG